MIFTNGKGSHEAMLSSKAGKAYFESLPEGWEVSDGTWKRWIRDGTLRAYRPGPRLRVRIKPSDIRELAGRQAREE